MDVHQEHWGDVDHLNVQELDGMDGGDAEGRGLLVGVVELVEVLVQEGHVVDAVQPVRDVVGGHEDEGELEDGPEQAVPAQVEVERGVAAVSDPGGQGRGEHGAEGEREHTDGHFMELVLKTRGQGEILCSTSVNNADLS